MIDYNTPFNQHVIKYLMYKYLMDSGDQYPTDWNEYFNTIRRRFYILLNGSSRTVSPPL